LDTVTGERNRDETVHMDTDNNSQPNDDNANGDMDVDLGQPEPHAAHGQQHQQQSQSVVTVDGIPVTVILVHRHDNSPCGHDMYCPRGRRPYCTHCNCADDEGSCVHLQDYHNELDFEC
jgi:hypothetical protein